MTDSLRVLVAVNGDGSDEEAVKLACSEARRTKGTVFVVSVVTVSRHLPLESPDAADVERGEAVLGRMERLARNEKCMVEGEVIQAREPGPALVDEAVERGADLIVMGLSRKPRRSEADLGETMPYVLKRAPCRVWVVSGPLESPSRESVASGKRAGGFHLPFFKA